MSARDKITQSNAELLLNVDVSFSQKPEGGALMQETCRPLLSVNFQQVLRSEEESLWATRALPYMSHAVHRIKRFTKHTHTPVCKLANAPNSPHMLSLECCLAPCSITAERSPWTMALSLHSVVTLHIKASKGVQRHDLTVGGREGGEGVIMTRGTQGSYL